MHKGLFTGLLILLALTIESSHAGRCDNADRLRVGLIQSPPFVIQHPNGDWSGLTVELWQRLADQLDIDYQFCDQSFEGSALNVSNGLVQVQQQQLDVALGALTITSPREKLGDFSLPFFHTGLSIATRPEDHTWDELWQWATRPTSLMVVLFLVVMAPLLTLLFHRLEQHQEQELMQGASHHRFATTMLWVTLICTGRASAFDMKSFQARILATLLSFVGVTVLASLVAVATSSTVLSTLEQKSDTLSGLQSVRVGAVDGTNVRSFLGDHGIRTEMLPDLPTALEALMQKKIDAVVHDRPTLQHQIHMRPADQRPELQVTLLNEEYYGLYLQQHSALRESINQTLPRLLMSDNWQRTLNRYLGSQHGR